MADRAAEQTVNVIASQSVKATKNGGPQGFDANKKIKGSKRHFITETRSNMQDTITHTAKIQERDGTPDAITYTKESFPTLTHLFCDGGYAGDKREVAMQKRGGRSSRSSNDLMA